MALQEGEWDGTHDSVGLENETIFEVHLDVGLMALGGLCFVRGWTQLWGGWIDGKQVDTLFGAFRSSLVGRNALDPFGGATGWWRRS